jgi:hypothetical protein
VPYGAEMHDGIRELLAQGLLERAGAHVGAVEGGACGPALPLVGVDSHHAEIARESAGEQPPVPAGDPDDQDFFHASHERRRLGGML